MTRLFSRLANGLHLLAGIAMTIMMLQVTADVLLKYLFNSPIQGTIELVATYYMVAIAFLPLAYLALHERHVSVDIVVQTMEPRMKRFTMVFANFVSAIYCALLAWRGAVNAIRATQVGEVWAAALVDIPVWPTRWFFPAGAALAAVVFLLVALRYLSDPKAVETASSASHYKD